MSGPVQKRRAEKLTSALSRPLPEPSKQLDMFSAFAEEIPPQYTAILELFDAIPKFYAGAVTDRSTGNQLNTATRQFNWNDNSFSVHLKPIIIDAGDGTGRKEIIAGEREETVYRVLRKMASSSTVPRSVRGNSKPGAGEGLCIQFTLHELRRGLEEVKRGYKVSEIREALQVLAESPLRVTNDTTSREIYAGPYILLEYVSDKKDPERTLCSVTFNRLATVAIVNGLYDRIHYLRLMSLPTSLSQWLYETMTRQFRQAATGMAYKIALERIMREGPMRPYAELRKAVERIDDAFEALVNQNVLSPFPTVSKEFIFEDRVARGRKKIKNCIWTVYPSEEFIKDVRTDNAVKARRDALPHAP